MGGALVCLNMINFETEVRGAEQATLRIRGIEKRLKADIVEAISAAANEAQQVLEQGAPRGDSHRLAASVRNDGVSFHPGGLGGGGFWEVDVSVGEGIDYLKFVVEGTGIHAGRGNITAHGPYPMRWKGATIWGDPRKARRGIRGDTHIAFETEGQEPQEQWITNANLRAQGEIARRVAEIDARHES